MDDYYEKYKKYKTKYLDIKKCYFDEEQIEKLIKDIIEPNIKIKINNLNKDNDQIAFSILKNGYKKGECYNDNHYNNSLSVFKKQLNKKCLFNIILEKVQENINKNIYIVDGMNFVSSFMKYLVDNKNNIKVQNFLKTKKWSDVNEFYQLSKISTSTDINEILSNDKDIGKDDYSKNLFRINFLKDCFDQIFSINSNDFYIIFHHGFNYVDSFIKGKLRRGYSDELYKYAYTDKNYIFASTYLQDSIISFMSTYKGKINNILKNVLISTNKYDTKNLEKIINDELNYKYIFKQKNNNIVGDLENKYFEYISKNNIVSKKVCKCSNETDDYCILILYIYLKYIYNIKNVYIVSNDKYGWTKNDISNENIVSIEQFLK